MWPVFLLAVSCGGPQQEPCDPVAAEAIMVGAQAAVDYLVESDACPAAKYPDLLDCPAYQDLRAVTKRALEDGACAL